jgi:hypothetical protein
MTDLGLMSYFLEWRWNKAIMKSLYVKKSMLKRSWKFFNRELQKHKHSYESEGKNQQEWWNKQSGWRSVQKSDWVFDVSYNNKIWYCIWCKFALTIHALCKWITSSMRKKNNKIYQGYNKLRYKVLLFLKFYASWLLWQWLGQDLWMIWKALQAIVLASDQACSLGVQGSKMWFLKAQLRSNI